MCLIPAKLNVNTSIMQEFPSWLTSLRMFSVEVGCFPNMDKFGKKLLNINIKSTRQGDQIWLAVHGRGVQRF
jgi:hypothetical protein